MKVLVCGDRNWTDRKAIRVCLRELTKQGYTTVIHGCARGADRIAAFEAKQMWYTIEHYPAKWGLYHRAAGPIRNQQMLDEGKPVLVIAFHDHIELSSGTADMLSRAEKSGIPYALISHPTISFT